MLEWRHNLSDQERLFMRHVWRSKDIVLKPQKSPTWKWSSQQYHICVDFFQHQPFLLPWPAQQLLTDNLEGTQKHPLRCLYSWTSTFWDNACLPFFAYTLKIWHSFKQNTCFQKIAGNQSIQNGPYKRIPDSVTRYIRPWLPWLPVIIFWSLKIVTEISQSWVPNPKVVRTKSRGLSQGCKIHWKVKKRKRSLGTDSVTRYKSGCVRGQWLTGHLLRRFD